MHTLTRNKNTELVCSSDPLASIARDFFGLGSFTSARNDAPKARGPRFDFIESPESYTLRGNLPGLSEEQLDLTVHQGVLIIKGSYGEDEVTEDSTFLVRERRFGEFSRSLKLPKNADPTQVEANLKHGVLTVSIAKKEEVKARKITIGS